MGTKNKVERREYTRYKAPSGTFVSIFSEHHETTGFLIDLSISGASFEYILLDKQLPVTKQIDISFNNDEFNIHNIPCRFMFDVNVGDQEHEPVVWHKVGIRFGELSLKQKNNLRHLLNHYWGYPIQLPLSASSKSEPSPLLMDSDDIFLSRLKLIVIAAKAYLKGYPFGQYRIKSISRNANEIIKHLPHQGIFRFGESHSILFKEHIMILSKAFSKMPIKSYVKADIEISIKCISEQLTFDKSFDDMEFLKFA
jgi:hypothetical protein